MGSTIIYMQYNVATLLIKQRHWYDIGTFLKQILSKLFIAPWPIRMSLGSYGGHIVRLWRGRLLSVPLGEQASWRRCMRLFRPRGVIWGGLGGPSPPKEKEKKKKERKKGKREKKRKKRKKRKKETMNNVKLQHIKCCFFQFFNSPVALKNKKNFWPPRKSWNDAPVQVCATWFLSSKSDFRLSWTYFFIINAEYTRLVCVWFPELLTYLFSFSPHTFHNNYFDRLIQS